MSIQVTDFKWEKGKNDYKYIELLEKTLKNEQAITAKAVAKIRKLSAENKEIRNKAIDEFAEKIKWEYKNGTDIPRREKDFAIAITDKVAEQMKTGGENKYNISNILYAEGECDM